MANGNDKCASCGGDRGIHHYQTDQCPVGGVESSVNKPQEWKNSTFAAEVIPFSPPDQLARDMTKREAFAMAAMQGLIEMVGADDHSYVARHAVEQADALINALNAEK